MIASLLQAGLERSAVETGWRVYGGYVFADPYFLIALLIVPIVMLLGRGRRRYAHVRVPGISGEVQASGLQRLTGLVVLAEGLALLLAVVALARPLKGSESFVSTTEGVDILLLIDRSSSMSQEIDASRKTRFDMAKEVIGQFAERRMTDQEGAADNVGLLGFALFTELLCPFTLDAESLLGVLAELNYETSKRLDGTGIGVALGTAVEVMDGSDAASRVIVLLTDGENTIDLVTPMDAARMAAEQGIRVYTIFSGPKTVRARSLRQGRLVQRPVDVGDLPAIAELTGGRFFHAVDGKDLEGTYAAIEELERTERSSTRFAEHYDLYPQWLRLALLLYGVAFLSRHTWARRVS